LTFIVPPVQVSLPSWHIHRNFINTNVLHIIHAISYPPVNPAKTPISYNKYTRFPIKSNTYLTLYQYAVNTHFIRINSVLTP